MSIAAMLNEFKVRTSASEGQFQGDDVEIVPMNPYRQRIMAICANQAWRRVA